MLESVRPSALFSLIRAPIRCLLSRPGPDVPETETRHVHPVAACPRTSLHTFHPDSPQVLPRSRTQRGHQVWPTEDGNTTARMRIALAEATDEHLHAVLGLIEDARDWLWTKETDQWATPWPNEKARDARVLKGLQSRTTWLVWDGDIPAATVTITTRKNAAVWSKPGCTCDLGERAVFAHRLITSRKYAGLGLGTELIDWAGLRGQRLYGAKWVRIDVWRTNEGLHNYYIERGFEPCGFCTNPAYPSGALFQKPVSAIRMPSDPQFTEIPPSAESIADRSPVGSAR